MISADKLKEIKNYLVKAQNPLIFFDDDPDGLCSFLILKQLNDHAKGIVIKSSPNLDILYVKKIEELSPDVVFVLDVPLISQDFIDNVHVPLVWLDHHPVVERKGVHYYNPRIQDPDDNSPTSYWAYKVSNNQETMWISVTGSIADWYIPDFFSEFKDQYPNLVDHQKDPASIIFETRLGELIRALSFLLKGKALDVRRNISIISKIKDPYDIIEQRTARGRFLHKQFLRIKKQYDELIEKAIKIKDKKMIIFLYPDTKMSFTSELSNELIYRNPDKLILVGREKGDVIKLSMRSTKLILPPMIEKALVDVKGYGGGHCLRGDTLIQLPDGNICEARELEINKEICSMNLSNYKLEKSFVNEKFKKNKREILKIKAKPYSIECSLDHNIFRFNKWGKIEEIPAKLLKKGDFVIGLRKINIIGNKQRLPLLAKEKAHIISTYNKYKPIKISKFMNKEFCQMYGYLIGDGNIYASDTVEFRDKDVELLKYYNKLIINQLGIKGKIKPIKNKDCYKLKIHSSLFAKLFEKINEGWSKNKQILPIIKRLQNKELSYFI
ncbi:hypothetical protein J4427_00710, partial [Candidatus Woesearchaeota archaeon]|nr:hypothetical protein [Candidatus Woesearchaeota archaeon]